MDILRRVKGVFLTTTPQVSGIYKSANTMFTTSTIEGFRKKMEGASRYWISNFYDRDTGTGIPCKRVFLTTTLDLRVL